VNELGGITFEIGAGARRRFVKWAPAGSGPDLAVATWSTTWSYGPGWETPDGTSYYRLLWDLGP
jgi:hypothetical protein